MVAGQNLLCRWINSNWSHSQRFLAMGVLRPTTAYLWQELWFSNPVSETEGFITCFVLEEYAWGGRDGRASWEKLGSERLWKWMAVDGRSISCLLRVWAILFSHAWARPDCLRFFGLLVPQLRSSCSTWERRYWEEVLQANTAQLQQDRGQDSVLNDDVWETYQDMITVV